MARKARIAFLILLGSYPPLFMYARNQGELDLSNLGAPLILSICIPLVVALSWYPMLRDWTRAASIAAWFSIAFWSVGYLSGGILFAGIDYGAVEGVTSVVLFVTVYLAGRAVMATRSRMDPRIISAAAVLSGVLVLYSVASILPTEVLRQMRRLSPRVGSPVSIRSAASPGWMGALPISST